MPYLKFIGAFVLIFMALTFAFWALSAAMRTYFEKREFDRRLANRIRELGQDK